MNTPFSSDDVLSWQQKSHDYWMKGAYERASYYYEQAIKVEPENRLHYWHLGLMLLLQGEEVEAQSTWLLALADGTSEEVEVWTNQLLEVLEGEANRQTELEAYSIAWTIRQHIREISPSQINNLLKLVDLSIEIENYQPENLNELGIIELLNSKLLDEVEPLLLSHILRKILRFSPTHPVSFEFTEACSGYLNQSIEFLDILLALAYEVAYSLRNQPLAVQYLEFGLKIFPQQVEILQTLATFYADLGKYEKAIDFAKLSYSLSQKFPQKLYCHHLILRAMFNGGGYWSKILSVIREHENLIESLQNYNPTELGPSHALAGLHSTSFYFPYFQDEPRKNLHFRQLTAKTVQVNFKADYSETIEKYNQRNYSVIQTSQSRKTLKIGYLSHCLRRHSVGWLARWLFKYHNRERYQFYSYLLASKQDNDHLLEWYKQQCFQTHQYGLGGLEVADQIYEDGIDILVDLDSLTLAKSCEIMTMKPAPIQVTWLGWDVSGVPALDYVIADRYVLPEDAKNYYQEKIIRLPHCYLGVDGFEVGVPTLRRDQLNIPSDAVIYYTTQRGAKYHPHTVRLQMKILKAVHNSYFLVKGYGEEETLSSFLIAIAEEEGVSADRIKFLKNDSFEEIHRANLAIADVVLDTYPYNGATTTMETLWMGIPLVTRVGEQFAARNSYTMMINAGITEGIAWTDEEYVEWGIRLGTDESLRQQVSWKLQKSRQTAPLWNGKQFTRDMEIAFEQMWQQSIGE